MNRSSEPELLTERDKRCAPNVSFQDGSCISLEGLIAMANAYNEIYDEQIKLYDNIETLNPSKYKTHLVKEFSKRLKDICDDQKCWVKTVFNKILENSLKNELSKYTFRTNGPEGQFTWLNTFNINDIMGQYEKKYKDFKFLGANPIDFADLNMEISNYDIEKSYKTGKSKLGVVFNLDEHYKSGSHWVGLFSDLDKGKVYFFDSYGISPEKRIRQYMRKLAKYCESRGKTIDSRHNKIRHQFKNSECGVYSVNFIIRLLHGETFEEITENITTDTEINKCRNEYFYNVNI